MVEPEDTDHADDDAGGGSGEGSGELSEADRAELEKLRHEVHELRAGKQEEAAAKAGRWRLPRNALAGLLVVLVLVLTPVTVLARYARSELLDTDRYVATVGPLARDPAVQAALATRLTNEAMTHLEVEDNVDKALQAIVDDVGAPSILTSLSTPIADQIAEFVREHVQDFAASDTFATLWVEANRTAHKELDAALTGDHDGAVQIDEGQVTLDLGPAVATLRQSLIDRGFGLASNIPDVSTELVLVDSPDLARIQTEVRWFDRIATWLPYVVVALIAAAVGVATNRRRGLLACAVAATVGCIILGLALTVARDWFVSTGADGTLQDGDAAAAIADALLHPLRTTNRAVMVLGLVVSLVVLVTGPSSAARSLRVTAGRGVAAARRLALRDRPPTPVEAWVATNRNLLRVGIVGAAVVVLVLWRYPDGGVVAAIALVTIAALLLVELVANASTSDQATRSGATPTPPRPA